MGNEAAPNRAHPRSVSTQGSACTETCACAWAGAHKASICFTGLTGKESKDMGQGGRCAQLVQTPLVKSVSVCSCASTWRVRAYDY
eukprot:661470-Pleurochrysis_carterae.AAC.1